MDSKLTGAPAGGAATGTLADTDVSDISGDTVNPPPEKASAHAAAIAAKADAAAAGKSPDAQDAAAAAAAARANPRKMIPSLRALADEDRATAEEGACLVANVHDYGRVHRGDRVPLGDPPGRLYLRQRTAARGLAVLPEDHRDCPAVLGCRLRGDLRRRPRHHGSGQQGRARRQVRQRGPEHRASARAAGQSVPGHRHRASGTSSRARSPS